MALSNDDKNFIADLISNTEKKLEGKILDTEKKLAEKILEVDRKVWRLEEKTDKRFDETFLKFKDDILTNSDKVLKEVIAMREEQAAHHGQHERVDNRLDRVEKHAGLPPYVD